MAIEAFLFNAGIILISLIIIILSADYILESIVHYARRLGLSDAIIGLVVISLAASLPEIIAALTGLFAGDIGITTGTLIGTNMVHLAFVTGLIAILGRKVKLSFEIFENTKLLIWSLILLPFILMSDGELTRPDGLLLIAAFFFYMITLWEREGSLGKIKKNVSLRTIGKDILIFSGCFLSLLLAGQLLVYGAINISNLLSVPTFLIAIIVIGIGSALPDFIVSIKSLRKSHQEIGLGEVIGSTLLEFLFFLGLIALFHPLKVDVLGAFIAGIFLVGCMTFLFLSIHNQKLTWKHGIVLLTAYFLFLVLQVLVL
ncbi:sodium:calcium antiporter [Candidatus Woesearchaeota archaeon]|nr:sodium:calcium antiporter [Candidatus Woesearchaeota archaeon]